MKKYPKGARWFVVYDGDVHGPLKTTQPKGIKELFYDSPIRSTTGLRFVVVRPRGCIQWWLFKRVALAEPEFVDRGKHRDALIARAVLT